MLTSSRGPPSCSSFVLRDASAKDTSSHDTVINNYIWGGPAQVEVIITPETINNYHVRQLDTGCWIGDGEWKGRVGSSVAPCNRRGGERVDRNSPRVWNLSRARATTSTGNFIPGRLVSPASCSSSVSSVRSLAIPFFSLTPMASPPCLIRRSRPWRADRRCPCRWILPRFRYSFAFSLSFSPPDVSPCALLARPWKEKLGIKWVPSTAQGIIIHADERNASPR